MEMLAAGLRVNSTFSELSLAYYNIGQEPARFLLEIVINQKTQIKDINLQGNYLRNQGVCTLFRRLAINQTVESVNLTENQFGEDEEVIKSLKNLILTSQ